MADANPATTHPPSQTGDVFFLLKELGRCHALIWPMLYRTSPGKCCGCLTFVIESPVCVGMLLEARRGDRNCYWGRQEAEMCQMCKNIPKLQASFQRMLVHVWSNVDSPKGIQLLDSPLSTKSMISPSHVFFDFPEKNFDSWQLDWYFINHRIITINTLRPRQIGRHFADAV